MYCIIYENIMNMRQILCKGHSTITAAFSFEVYMGHKSNPQGAAQRQTVHYGMEPSTLYHGR